MQDLRTRIQIFIGICLVCALSLGAYFYWVKMRTASTTPVTRAAGAAQPRQIFFRYTGVDDNYGKLAVVDYNALDQPRFVENLRCEFVHFASGHGICLASTGGALPTYSALVFDANFKELFSVPLQGGPSRTRVSPDGKLAAFTVFLTGHAYTSVDFTTQTLLVDTVGRKVLSSLEDFQVTRDGKPFYAADFNFWGVTFTPDSQRFYCTLSSNRSHYLVQGDVAAHTAVVVHENVECPSLSPDGLHVAYKKRLMVNGRLFWQLHVLDLATQQETPLAEKRSVDDQLEWLDNTHVLYAVSDNPEGSSATTNVWKADADGKAAPAIFLPKAFSPAVVR
jgi:hypothetical protein